MNKYALLQAPPTSECYAGQIIVVPIRSNLNKAHNIELLAKGYVHIGFIETNKPASYFGHGFNATLEEKCDDMRRLLNQALEILK
jgi:hypothetical protein